MNNQDNRKYLVVNAFAEESFGGNPAGVFPTADGLSDEDMRNIARQLNLVETVFVFSSEEPGVNRHLRYFTPTKELPVAGHPTIAAWTGLLEEGFLGSESQTEYKQRTGAGIQDIRVQRGNGRFIIQMKQPPAVFREVIPDRARVAEVFGIHESDIMESLPIQCVDSGLGHIIVPVKNLEALMGVRRNIKELKALCEETGMREAQLFAFETRERSFDLHTRNICPRDGIEDPACGVGNGALGAYLAENYYQEKTHFSFIAEQGLIVDMPAVIRVEVIVEPDGQRAVYIGGTGVVMAKGRMVF